MIGGAAIPLALVLMWPRMSTVGTIAAPWTALAMSFTAWLVCTKTRDGSITVETTGGVYNALAGNVVAVVSGPLIAVGLSYAFPWKYTATDPVAIERNLKIMGRDQRNVGDAVSARAQTQELQSPVPGGNPEIGMTDVKGSEKGGPQGVVEQPSCDIENGEVESDNSMFLDPKTVKASTRLAIGFCVGFFLIAIVLVPFSLYGSGWIFTRAGFKGWCIFSFIWVWCSMFICVFWPLIESRATIIAIVRGVLRVKK